MTTCRSWICATRTLKPFTALMRRASTARLTIWRYFRARLFTASQRSTICTARGAWRGTVLPSRTVTACCGKKPCTSTAWKPGILPAQGLTWSRHRWTVSVAWLPSWWGPTARKGVRSRRVRCCAGASKTLIPCRFCKTVKKSVPSVSGMAIKRRLPSVPIRISG